MNENTEETPVDHETVANAQAETIEHLSIKVAYLAQENMTLRDQLTDYRIKSGEISLKG